METAFCDELNLVSIMVLFSVADDSDGLAVAD